MKNMIRPLTTMATLCALAPASALAQDSGSENDWNFTLTPFLWAMNINGTAGVGPLDSALDLDLRDDILDNLEGAFMLHFEANHDRLSLFAEYQYARLEPEKTFARGLKATVDFKYTTAELGVGYTVAGVLDNNAALQLIGGARYYGQTLDAGIVPGPMLAGADESWWDGFLGARVTMPLSGNWRLILRGDGATGGSDATWQAAGYFDWRFNDWGSLLFGYRHLNIGYDNDRTGRNRYVFDAKLRGLLLGLGISW